MVEVLEAMGEAVDGYVYCMRMKCVLLWSCLSRDLKEPVRGASPIRSIWSG